MEFLPVADIMPICLDKPFSYCDKMHLAETNPAFTMVIIVQWDKRSHINLWRSSRALSEIQNGEDVQCY